MQEGQRACREDASSIVRVSDDASDALGKGDKARRCGSLGLQRLGIGELVA